MGRLCAVLSVCLALGMVGCDSGTVQSDPTESVVPSDHASPTSSTTTGSGIAGPSTSPVATTAATDEMVFGRVVDSEIGPGYEAVRTPGGFEVGPLLLLLRDGTILDLAPSTYINNACTNIPIPAVEDDEPCYVVASLDAAGSVVSIRVLSFQRLHEGDTSPTLFTRVASIAGASNSELTIDAGITLTADASELSIDCDARTLQELVGLTPAGFILILDPETGRITGVECTEFF